MELRELLFITKCCVAAVLGAGTIAAQNPFDTPEGTSQGRTLFQTHCSYCHGANGEGGKGADLTSGQYRRGGSDVDLFATVRNGIGSEMPAIRASDDDVWKMVAFVKKIGADTLTEKPAGDPTAGKAIYQGKGACARCHAIGSEGGSLGPDLSFVGRRRSLKSLWQSLVEPGSDVSINYRTMQVVTKNGQSISGIRVNEDDVSIQMRDAEDNLRSFLKEDVREIRHGRPSLMPSYSSTFSRKELDDLVAYLNSLRGAQ
jgi:putative heme-binding domain-containing protein